MFSNPSLIGASYLMPLLTHRGPPLIESVPWCCFPLAKLLTTDEQRCQSLNSTASRSSLREPVMEADLTTGPAVLFVHDQMDPNTTSFHLNTTPTGTAPHQVCNAKFCNGFCMRSKLFCR
ncbi:unnamed protein product [Echinostoma caproni]|uniref:Secreted protein n=1 Tax=Echinostoma caproni TaxID=27848 RepID=A0A183BAV9_9TREM|nr:unnamed protein product [Echinostoma caproni]